MEDGERFVAGRDIAIRKLQMPVDGTTGIATFQH
jgi:hypothetical protein